MSLETDALLLRAKWEEWVKLRYEAHRVGFLFDALVMEIKARHVIPPGFSIDYLGDFSVKPDEDCAKAPSK